LVELFIPERSCSEKPFFCVHSLGANLVNFRRIAMHMGGNRPIYGLQPHGLDGAQKPFERIEDIASAYVDEILRKQPSGPFLLGGVCLGGVIAYEIAQQLQARGEAVPLVALIDSYAPGKYRYLQSRSPLSEYLDRHLGDILVLRKRDRLRYAVRWTANGFIRLGRALGLRERSSIAEATRRVTRAHRRAFLAYKPKPYGGRIVQFLCGEASHRSYEDRRLAWSSLASSGFEVRLVPGNHHTMIEDPHAQVLARELQQCLDRAQGSRFAMSLGVNRKEVPKSYDPVYGDRITALVG
jgi:thioesterase domain-containing protein